MVKLIKTNTPRNHFHNRSTMIKDNWQCPKCKTEYPEMAVYNKQDGEFYWQVMCNGVEISECPFCKDKEPAQDSHLESAYEDRFYSEE